MHRLESDMIFPHCPGIACGLMLSVVASLSAQEAVVRGVVSDASTNRPVWQIDVAVSSPCVEHRQATGSDGAYAIASLRPGRYSVRAGSPALGWSGSEDVRVRAGDTLVVNLQVDGRASPPPSTRSLSATPDPTFPSGVYVPRDLDDAMTELRNMLSDESAEAFASDSEDDLGRYHFGLGWWLRNCWGLWSDSRLAGFFKSLGVAHPDDMSAILLTSFWRRSNNQPLKLAEQVASYTRN